MTFAVADLRVGRGTSWKLIKNRSMTLNIEKEAYQFLEEEQFF